MKTRGFRSEQLARGPLLLRSPSLLSMAVAARYVFLTTNSEHRPDKRRRVGTVVCCRGILPETKLKPRNSPTSPENSPKALRTRPDKLSIRREGNSGIIPLNAVGENRQTKSGRWIRRRCEGEVGLNDRSSAGVSGDRGHLKIIFLLFQSALNSRLTRISVTIRS